MPDISGTTIVEHATFYRRSTDVLIVGNLNSWSIWSRSFWNNSDYDAVAVNGFASVEQMVKMGYGDDVFKKATASMKSGEVMEVSNLVHDTNKIRTMSMSQLWEVIEMTGPKK